MPYTLDSIVYADSAGRGIPASVILETNEGRLTKPSNVYDGSGLMTFPQLVSDNITVKVLPDEAGKWISRSFNVNALPGFAQLNGTQLVIQGESSTVPFDVHESGFIRAQGAGFVKEDGTPWHLAGLLLHTGICNVAKGEDLSWLFAYMDSIGANTGVVIGCHLSDWKWAYGYGYDPRRADHLGILGSLFTQFADAHKRVLFQVLADTQGLTLAEKQSIYSTARLAASGRWNVLLGKGNESAVNGWQPSDLPNYVAADLGGVPTSQGSSGATPIAPHLDFAQWETRRQPGTPTWKVADDAGAGILEMHGGYSGFPGYPGPIVMVETDLFNDVNPDEYGDYRLTDPAWAGLLGANGGPNSAGSCFGTSNSLVVKPNGPIADACTREYFRRFWRAAS